MALIRGKVNPLNVLGLRRLTHIPPHFAKMTTSKVDKFDIIENWVYTKLDSRFCIRKTYKVNDENKIVEIIEIGVEDPKELSMLSLGCPHLH
jgi:hypothetical protein